MNPEGEGKQKKYFFLSTHLQLENDKGGWF